MTEYFYPVGNGSGNGDGYGYSDGYGYGDGYGFGYGAISTRTRRRS